MPPPRNQGGLPVPYLIAGASTVVVLAAVLLMMGGGGGHEVPSDSAGAIKAAKFFMRNTTSIYSTPKPSLIVDDKPTATRTSKGYTVRGRVGFRPEKDKPPTNFTSWECYVEFDTKRRAWAVADWKQR